MIAHMLCFHPKLKLILSGSLKQKALKKILKEKYLFCQFGILTSTSELLMYLAKRIHMMK